MRSLADAIDRARQGSDESATREAVTALAAAILDGTPGGGFEISPQRWIGLGRYLEELIAVLPEELRVKATEDIDRMLQARLPQGWPDDGSTSTNEPLALRVTRDFRNSRFAARASKQIASLLLARGQLEGYLELAGDQADAALRAGLEELLDHGKPEQPTGVCIDEPAQLLTRVDWERATGSKRPSWVGATRHTPLAVGDRIYVPSPDAVQSYEAHTGALVWRTPFLGKAPSPLPGSRQTLALMGSQLVATDLTAATSFDRFNGDLLWRLSIPDLVKQASSDEESNLTTQAISVTQPVSSERGVLFAVLSMKGDKLAAHLFLVNGEGKVRWSRRAGTANGATYLALGSARPALAVRGDHAYMLSERGFLSAFHLADGALEWSVTYPGFSPSGTTDALRFGDATRDTAITCVNDFVISAPTDAGAILVWNRWTGQLVAELPRQHGRWWSTSGDDPVVAVTGPRRVAWWRLENGTPAFLRELVLPDGLPAISGRGYGHDDQWWFPHDRGFYRVNATTGKWHYRALPVESGVEEVTPIGDLLLAALRRADQ